MSVIDLSVILVASLFSIYGLSAAVECGIVVNMIRRDVTSRKMFTPLWEITNVFLVFGFTALAMLFNNALQSISHDLISTLAAALFAMLIRAALVLGIFYIKDEDTVPNWQVWLFAVGTFLVPVSFSAAGAYLLTGQPFWHTTLGWVLVMLSFVSMFAGGVSIIKSKVIKPAFSHISFAFWMLCLGSVLPLAVLHTNNNLALWPFGAIEAMSLGGLTLLLAGIVLKRRIALRSYTVAILLAVPILLAWANKPYLISGKMSLENAFGAQTYANAVVVGLIVMLPIIVGGGWMFVRLLGSTGKSNY